MRRLATLALAFTMAAAACGGTTPSGSTTPTGGAPADMSALAPAKDVAPAATITWWHAMSGVNGDALNKIVAGFNASQSKIKVEAIFQGTYDDLLAKLNTAIASNAAPALVQVYDIGQRYMYDSQQVVPMQAFIDRDKFDTKDFEPAVINYYKYQDKLQSMPFNASTPTAPPTPSTRRRPRCTSRAPRGCAVTSRRSRGSGSSARASTHDPTASPPPAATSSVEPRSTS